MGTNFRAVVYVCFEAWEGKLRDVVGNVKFYCLRMVVGSVLPFYPRSDCLFFCFFPPRSVFSWIFLQITFSVIIFQNQGFEKSVIIS